MLRIRRVTVRHTDHPRSWFEALPDGHHGWRIAVGHDGLRDAGAERGLWLAGSAVLGRVEPPTARATAARRRSRADNVHEAYRLRDEGLSAAKIALRMKADERTVWKWLQDDPARP